MGTHRMSQFGWRAFQVAIVMGIGYAAQGSDASPAAVMVFGILTAALATGVLAALFRWFRFALGRDTVEDRIWREAPTPRSNLAPADHLAKPIGLRKRAAR